MVCPKEAYQWAEGPVDPVGITLEDTEIEDALNRARWGRDIARQNSSASCLRKRDAGHLPPGIDP